jgi:hypothetical protein
MFVISWRTVARSKKCPDLHQYRDVGSLHLSHDEAIEPNGVFRRPSEEIQTTPAMPGRVLWNHAGEPFMKSIITASLVTAFAVSTASGQVLYSTSFESPFTQGPLRNQDGWGGISWIGGTDTDRVVAGTAATGVQSVLHDASVLAPPQLGGVGKHIGYWPLLNNRPVIRVSWSSFVASAQSGETLFGFAVVSGAGASPWPTLAAAAIDLQGQIWFSDENFYGIASGTMVPLDSWNRMAMYCDFASRQYTLTVNGRITVINAPFGTLADDFFRGGSFLTQTNEVSTAVAYSDDLSIEALTTGPCYANCDGSTTAPVLNVEDFTCFINSFAEGLTLDAHQQVHHRANCDGSTTVPVLNIDDFTCFINAFAQGCD